MEEISVPYTIGSETKQLAISLLHKAQAKLRWVNTITVNASLLKANGEFI